MAPGERDVPLFIPPARAGEQRRGDPTVRSAGRGKRKRDRCDDEGARTMTSRVARFACVAAVVVGSVVMPLATRGQSHFVGGDRPLVTAQRGLTEIPDQDVAAELAGFQPAAGFEINLFAAEPQLSKPI